MQPNQTGTNQLKYNIIKKTFFLLISAVLTVISADAQGSHTLSLADGETFPNSVPHPVIRTEQVNGDDIVVSYHIDEILIEPDTLYVGTNWCLLDDFGRTYEPGTASLPLRIDNIRLPMGADSAIVTLNKVTYKDFHCPITPAHPYLSDVSKVSYTKDNVPPIAMSTIGKPMI